MANISRFNRTLMSFAVVGLLAVFCFTVRFAQANASDETQDNEVIKPVKLFIVKDHLFASHDSFLAEVDAANRAQLSFPVGGEIQDLTVKMGQSVKKGQVLASLDPTDIKLGLDQAQAQFALATTHWNRARQLFTKKLISEDEYDRARTTFTAAQASHEQAKTELSNSKLIAPFDGTVATIFVKPHQVVDGKEAILNLIDNTHLDVSFTLPISYVERVGITNFVEQPMWVTIDSDPTFAIDGTIKELSTQPNSDTNSYPATLKVTRPLHRNILAGMTAQVHVANENMRQNISLPNSAWVSRNADQGTLWLMDPITNRAFKKTVQLNAQGQVVDGLYEDDLVIVAGIETLSEGLVVKQWLREEGI